MLLTAGAVVLAVPPMSAVYQFRVVPLAGIADNTGAVSPGQIAAGVVKVGAFGGA